MTKVEYKCELLYRCLYALYKLYKFTNDLKKNV